MRTSHRCIGSMLPMLQVRVNENGICYVGLQIATAEDFAKKIRYT